MWVLGKGFFIFFKALAYSYGGGEGDVGGELAAGQGSPEFNGEDTGNESCLGLGTSSRVELCN